MKKVKNDEILDELQFVFLNGVVFEKLFYIDGRKC
jgi:hypothetical protein